MLRQPTTQSDQPVLGHTQRGARADTPRECTARGLRQHNATSLIGWTMQNVHTHIQPDPCHVKPGVHTHTCTVLWRTNRRALQLNIVADCDGLETDSLLCVCGCCCGCAGPAAAAVRRGSTMNHNTSCHTLHHQNLAAHRLAECRQAKSPWPFLHRWKRGCICTSGEVGSAETL